MYGVLYEILRVSLENFSTINDYFLRTFKGQKLKFLIIINGYWQITGTVDYSCIGEINPGISEEPRTAFEV